MIKDSFCQPANIIIQRIMKITQKIAPFFFRKNLQQGEGMYNVSE